MRIGEHAGPGGSPAGHRREIGIRVAIGAKPPQVLRLVLARTTMLLGIGTAIGLALVLLAGRVLSSIVYQASPRDPLVFAGVIGALVMVGIAACCAPARRSLRVSPTQALKSE
jgi:ABC-type antimicrobial peptide transport system permease subunit